MDADPIDNLLAQTSFAACIDRTFALENFDEPNVSLPPSEDLDATVAAGEANQEAAQLDRCHGAILQRAAQLSTQLPPRTDITQEKLVPGSVVLSDEASFLLDRFTKQQQQQVLLDTQQGHKEPELIQQGHARHPQTPTHSQQGSSLPLGLPQVATPAHLQPVVQTSTQTTPVPTLPPHSGPPPSPTRSDSTLSSTHSVIEMVRVSPNSLKRTAQQAGLLGTQHGTPSHPHRPGVTDGTTPVTPSKQTKTTSAPPSSAKRKVKFADARYLIDTKTKNAQIVEETCSALDDLFEAEDALEQDTSDRTAQEQTQARHAYFDVSGAQKRMTTAATSRLLNVLRRATAAGQLAYVDKEALARLMRILARSITVGDVALLKTLEEDMSDENERQWLCAMDAAHNAMLGALCVLEMLRLVEQDRGLFSEELLLAMIDTARFVFEDLFSRWFKLSDAKLVAIAKHNTVLSPLLSLNVQFLQQAAVLFAAFDVGENVLSRIEFMAIATIFSESPTKDHATCSVSTVEALKLNSMAILQAIFVTYTSQRRFILEEVLTHLNKLSTARQGARRYKLSDGRSIQLASALLLHLVQASAVVAPEQQEAFKLQRTPSKAKQDGDDTVDPEQQDTSGISPALYAFVDKSRAASMTASYIVNFLLGRAMKTNKAITAEDVPLRALLDSFVEDFLAVLALPEWPAAEILLRLIARKMIGLVADTNPGAQIKSFALDALCAMAKRIRELGVSLQAPLLDQHSATEAALFMLPKYELTAETTRQQLDALATAERGLLLHLHDLARADVHFKSVIELHLACFIANLAGNMNRIVDKRLQSDLSEVATSLAELHATEDLTSWRSLQAEGLTGPERTRACVSLLTFYGLLHMFDAILPRMLSVMDHAQPTLRTKALRSLGALSSTDPTVLSLKLVQAQVNLRLSDTSPQVRDAALDLLGKYIIANASLGKAYFGVLSDRLCDTGTAVRKRVVKLLRDIYTHNEEAELRAGIAQRTLLRLRDEEETVRDLAAKTLTELWFLWPELEFSERSSDIEALPIKLRKRIQGTAEIVSLLAASEQEATVELLTELLVTYSEFESKEVRHQPRYLLSILTQAMLSEILHGNEMRPRLQHLLALKLIVSAMPTVLTVSQVESLKPLLSYAAGDFERLAASHVAAIYTLVIPRQASHSTAFLMEVQGILLEQLTKLPTKTLNQVVPCLCEVVRLRSDYRRIMSTIKSCLAKLVNLKGQVEPKTTKAAVLLLSLLGLFGRQLVITDPAVLTATWPNITSQESFVRRILETVTGFCPPGQLSAASESQKAAVRAFANICISYPRHFQDAAVLAIMDDIMHGTSIELKRLLVTVFQEFLASESTKAEKRQGKQNVKNKKSGAAEVDVEVLIGSTQKFATDGVSPGLMQRYLQDLLKAAGGPDDLLAFLALDVLGKIVLQGLSNPRDCVPTVIALETSPNAQLQTLALQTHVAISEKHEALIDSCYLDGVRAAFQYQEALGNAAGTGTDQRLLEPMYSVVRHNRSGRKRLLTGIARSLDINLDKLSKLNEADVRYAAFVARQVAQLSFATSEEVHFLIFGLDRVASATGFTFLQLVEGDAGAEGAPMQVAPEHHRAAAILALGASLRSHLRLVYNLSDAKCQAFNPQKLGNKSDVKPAVRQAIAALQPDWSALVQPDADRLSLFKTIFNQIERKIESDDDEVDAPGEATSPVSAAQVATDAVPLSDSTTAKVESSTNPASSEIVVPMEVET